MSDRGEDSIKAVPIATVRRSEQRVPSSTSNFWTYFSAEILMATSWAAWELLGTKGTSAWEKSEAPLPPPKRGCNFIHPKQLSPFPERLELPYPRGEIL